MSNPRVVYVRVSEELHAALADEAKVRGMTISSVARHRLESPRAQAASIVEVLRPIAETFNAMMALRLAATPDPELKRILRNVLDRAKDREQPGA